MLAVLAVVLIGSESLLWYSAAFELVDFRSFTFFGSFLTK